MGCLISTDPNLWKRARDLDASGPASEQPIPAGDGLDAAGDLSFPIRAAFYYPWFPAAWSQAGFTPYTNYTPTLGLYSSTDAAVIAQHLLAMQHGGIRAGIASWWGPGHHTDVALPALLAASTGSGFRWAIYYENEGAGDPPASQIGADLTYLQEKYGKDPSILRVDGHMVVFVYGGSADDCDMAARWAQGNTVGAYLVLKVFAGYAACPAQPDDWHQYAPVLPTDGQLPYAFTISPGYNKVGEAARLPRDLARWRQNVESMVASGARWQLVATFNEWGEGTAVESASEWSSASGFGQYLDVLHDDGGG